MRLDAANALGYKSVEEDEDGTIRLEGEIATKSQLDELDEYIEANRPKP